MYWTGGELQRRRPSPRSPMRGQEVARQRPRTAPPVSSSCVSMPRAGQKDGEPYDSIHILERYPGPRSVKTPANDLHHVKPRQVMTTMAYIECCTAVWV